MGSSGSKGKKKGKGGEQGGGKAPPQKDTTAPDPAYEPNVKGDILATIPAASAWKICGKEKELVARQSPVHIVRTRSGGRTVHYLWLEHPNAEQSRAFPIPLSTDFPVIRHASNYLVFPTVHFSKNLVVGIVAQVKGPEFEKFITILEITSELTDSAGLAQAKTNAQSLKKYARMGAGVIKSGTAVAAGIIGKGGAIVKEKVAPHKKEVKVDPKAVEAVHAAKIGSEKAVQMSAVAVGVVDTMAQSMAKAVAENIESQEQYQKAVAKVTSSAPPPLMLSSAKIYAGAAIIGYEMLYEALLDSTEVLVEASATEAAGIAEAKYGDQVGALSYDVAHIATDVVKVNRNVAKIGYKPVIKVIAKEAGLELADGATGGH